MTDEILDDREELTPEAAEEAASLAALYKWDSGWPWPLDAVQRWFEWLLNQILDVAKKVWDWAIYWGRELWNWLVDKISFAVDWIVRGIRNVTGYIWERLQAVWNVISELAVQVWNTVSDVVSSWVIRVWDWLKSFWGMVEEWFTYLGAAIANFFTVLWNNIADAFTAFGHQVMTWVARIPAAVEAKIIDPITDWFTGIVDKIVSWFQGIGQFMHRWVVEFPVWMLQDFPERVIYGLSTSLEWLGRFVEESVGNIIESIIGYVQRVTRVDPTNAPTVAQGLMSIVGVMVGGLSVMTIAGEFMNPLSHLGMGHVSAMIGDCVNYKAISGAFMGALVGAALSTPLRYYFNYALRPWLPGAGEIAESMSRDLFIDPDSINPELATGIKSLVGPDGGVAFEKRLLGYRGFHDEYYPMFKELANSRVGYFALAGIARGGTFDERLFRGDLMRAGYYKPIRELLLDMYRRSSIEEAKGLYIGYPMGAFREGWFDEARLSRELVECGIPEAGLPKYLHAAWISYEVDLLSDRLAGLKEAYRKGLVTDDEFSGSLEGWGMAEERAAEHLRREQIRRYGKL